MTLAPQTTIRPAHSATVEMRLFVNGSEFQVAQMGPDFLFLKRPPAAHAATAAEIEIIVDGSVDRFAVCLPNGLTEGDVRVELAERN